MNFKSLFSIINWYAYLLRENKSILNPSKIHFQLRYCLRCCRYNGKVSNKTNSNVIFHFYRFFLSPIFFRNDYIQANFLLDNFVTRARMITYLNETKRALNLLKPGRATKRNWCDCERLEHWSQIKTCERTKKRDQIHMISFWYSTIL